MISFSRWLITQTNRGGVVGCLSGQVYYDQCMPHPATYAETVGHIQDSHCGGILSHDLIEHLAIAKENYDRVVGSLR